MIEPYFLDSSISRGTPVLSPSSQFHGYVITVLYHTVFRRDPYFQVHIVVFMLQGSLSITTLFCTTEIYITCTLTLWGPIHEACIHMGFLYFSLKR